MKNQREIPRNCDRGVPAKTKVHSPKAPTSSPKRPLAPSPQYPTPASHNKNRGNSVIIWPPLKCGKAVYSCPTSGQDPGWKSAHCAIFFSNGRFHWPGPLSRGGRGTGIAKKPPMRRPSAPKNQSHTHRYARLVLISKRHALAVDPEPLLISAVSRTKLKARGSS